MRLIFNFERDWQIWLTAQLRSLNIKEKLSSDIGSLLKIYLATVHKHMPITRAWNIFYAKEFKYPEDKACVEGLYNLENKLRSGEHIRPYLSNGANRIVQDRLHGAIKVDAYHDLLLNDWGIYHFHLGNKPDKKILPKLLEPMKFYLFIFPRTQVMLILSVFINMVTGMI